jgi:hypothetical protein
MRMNKATLLVPLPWLLLDMAGILLVMWGGFEYFGWLHWWPQAWHYPYYELLLMMIGFFMMTPYQVKLLMAVMRRIQDIKKRNTDRSIAQCRDYRLDSHATHRKSEAQQYTRILLRQLAANRA